MFTLHCTAKLLETLKVEPLPPSPATTRLGSWYAGHLAGPRSSIVCISERTLLPVVVERCSAAQLPRALADGLATLLADLGVPAELVEQERFAMAQSSWAKTESRSLRGVLNEQAVMGCAILEDGPVHLAELNRQLANNIVKLQFPVDLTRQAFGLELKKIAPVPQAAPRVDAFEAVLRAFATRAPVDAHVVGVPVQVLEIRAEGSDKRGLVAVCERGGEQHHVSLADVVFDGAQPEARLSAEYRRRLGLDVHAPSFVQRRPKATAQALDAPLELVVLSVKSSALRCRLLGTRRELTLRTPVRNEVPGEIITVQATKQWTHAGHPYVSGKVVGSRLDVARLELVPLELRDQGEWRPDEEYWGEEGDPVPKWARAIIKKGARSAFEMEQVLPGADPEDSESDPIIESNELKEAGLRREAVEILQGLLGQDLRCLDAHAHLGNAAFDPDPALALRHYGAGTAIGELSLGAGFTGVLPWGFIDNRPWLRCLHGVGLCLWRLGRTSAAAEVFTQMLWLNPGDNQGARFNLRHIELGYEWTPED
jgi:hypothetical protein